jgi:hypothetical protein
MIIHQLEQASVQTMTAETAVINTLLQHDPAIVPTDALMTGSLLLKQSAGARIQFSHGKAPVLTDPWISSAEFVQSSVLIDVADRAAAVAWAAQWPTGDRDSVIEVRAVGCPGGVHCVSGDIAPDAPAESQHFMVIIHEEDAISSSIVPDLSVLEAMERRNIESVQSGIMLAGHGLHPSGDAAHIKFSAGKSSVVDGPFSESKELIAGYWLLQVHSRAEAIAWAMRYPFPVFNTVTISILPVIGMAVMSRFVPNPPHTELHHV